ncbi:MAG: hypothetical protein K2W33_09575, partial [Burkholderiales bacterium]|nr:hypothetical protein [Burkholderiales bacterium]
MATVPPAQPVCGLRPVLQKITTGGRAGPLTGSVQTAASGVSAGIRQPSSVQAGSDSTAAPGMGPAATGTSTGPLASQ